jgi:hypothetical protein
MTTATTAERLLAWTPGRGLALMEDPSSDIRLLVADSWLVNALHGIRPVTGWSGTGTGTGRPMRAGPASRAAEWRKWLQDIMEPLPAN